MENRRRNAGAVTGFVRAPALAYFGRAHWCPPWLAPSCFPVHSVSTPLPPPYFRQHRKELLDKPRKGLREELKEEVPDGGSSDGGSSDGGRKRPELGSALAAAVGGVMIVKHAPKTSRGLRAKFELGGDGLSTSHSKGRAAREAKGATVVAGSGDSGGGSGVGAEADLDVAGEALLASQHASSDDDRTTKGHAPAKAHQTHPAHAAAAVAPGSEPAAALPPAQGASPARPDAARDNAELKVRARSAYAPHLRLLYAPCKRNLSSGTPTFKGPTQSCVLAA